MIIEIRRDPARPNMFAAFWADGTPVFALVHRHWQTARIAARLASQAYPEAQLVYENLKLPREFTIGKEWLGMELGWLFVGRRNGEWIGSAPTKGQVKTICWAKHIRGE